MLNVVKVYPRACQCGKIITNTGDSSSDIELWEQVQKKKKEKCAIENDRENVPITIFFSGKGLRFSFQERDYDFFFFSLLQKKG